MDGFWLFKSMVSQSHGLITWPLKLWLWQVDGTKKQETWYNINTVLCNWQKDWSQSVGRCSHHPESSWLWIIYTVSVNEREGMGTTMQHALFPFCANHVCAHYLYLPTYSQHICELKKSQGLRNSKLSSFRLSTLNNPGKRTFVIILERKWISHNKSPWNQKICHRVWPLKVFEMSSTTHLEEPCPSLSNSHTPWVTIYSNWCHPSAPQSDRSLYPIRSKVFGAFWKVFRNCPTTQIAGGTA